MKRKITKLLRWSEKYTKTDMVYLSQGGFWLTSSKIFSSVASFASSIAFANLLPEETYGIFRYILSAVSLLAIPTLYGMESALTRSIAQGYGGNVKIAIRERIKWGTLGTVASLALGGYYFVMGNESLALTFIFAAIFIPFMEPFNSFAAILNGGKKFKLLALYSSATRIIVAILLIALVFVTQNTLLIIIVFFLSTTLLRYVFLQLTLKESHANHASDSSLISYGKHLSYMGILNRIASQADKILIFQQVGGAALATFYLALMPFKQIQNMFNGLATLALPKFSGSTIGTLRTTLPAKLGMMYIFIIPTVVLYYFAAPYIYALIYPQYLDAVFMSQLFMFQLLLFPITLLGTALTAQAQKRKLYIQSTTYSFIRIGLLAVLVPIYGVAGAIAGILITNVVSNIILVVLFMKT